MSEKITIDPSKWHVAVTFPKDASPEEKELFYIEMKKAMLTGQPLEINSESGIQVFPTAPKTQPNTSDKPAETTKEEVKQEAEKTEEKPAEEKKEEPKTETKPEETKTETTTEEKKEETKTEEKTE